MTLVQLRHFVVLAELGSFAQASRTLFLTQPALSRSIRGLEDELGASLFDRLGRRIALTPFGQEVLKRARRLVSDADALKAAGKGLCEGLIGKFRIGFSSAPGALFSTPLMLHMAQHYPKLHVQISRGSTTVLVNELRDQRLDAALVDVRSIVPSADLQVTQVFELSAGFLVRPEHPLARTGRALTLQELMAFPVASTPLSDEVARFLVARYGPMANPDDMVTIRCDETLSIVNLARRADVILLTVNAVAPDLVALDVTPSLGTNARFGLATLSDREEAPALQIVTGLLSRWIEQLRSNRSPADDDASSADRADPV